MDESFNKWQHSCAMNVIGVEGEELINWYLEQKEDELEGEEDYHREKALANMVLKKMVKVSLAYIPTYLNSKTNLAPGKYSHGSTRRGSHRWRSKLFNSWPSRLRSTSQLCPGGSLVPCHWFEKSIEFCVVNALVMTNALKDGRFWSLWYYTVDDLDVSDCIYHGLDGTFRMDVVYEDVKW